MKRLVWIVIAVCMLHACSPRKGYVIHGQLADADGLKVILAKVTADSDEPVSMNSSVIKKGKFQMKGIVEYPEYCILYAGDNGPLPLFVENTVIDIVLNLNNMQDSKVTGSKETDLLVEYFDKMSEFEDSLKKVNDDYIAFKLSGETDIEKEMGYMARRDTIQQQSIGFVKQFAEEHFNSIITALIVGNYSYYLLPEELELFANGFDDMNSKSPWVQNIKEKAAVVKRLAIGQPFVDVKLPDPDGNEIALSDYAGKGNYVLIDFWASWCTPCRVANPHVVKIYNQYKDKGFGIVGISLDKDKAEWTKAIATDELAWPQMSDLMYWQSEGAKLYSVYSIPHTVLLDRDGTILAKGLQPDELEEKLAELME